MISRSSLASSIASSIASSSSLAKILYVDGWFLEGIEYAVVWGGFLGISIIYFIITGLKILSSEKK